MGLAGSRTAARAGVRRRAEVTVATDARYAGGHRRGYVVRRALLVADIVALLISFVATEILLGRVSWGDLDPRVTKLFVDLPPEPSGLGRRREGVRPLRPRRGADGAHHGRRPRRRLPPRHGGRLDALRRRAGRRASTTPQLREHDRSSGSRDRPRHVGRSVARTLVRRSDAYVQNTVIVGAGDVGQLVARKLLQPPRVRDQRGRLRRRRAARARGPSSSTSTLLGPLDELAELVAVLDVERVVIAFSRGRTSRMLELVARRCATATCRSTSCRGCSRSSAPNVEHPRGRGAAARRPAAGAAVALVAAREARASTSSRSPCCSS